MQTAATEKKQKKRKKNSGGGGGRAAPGRKKKAPARKRASRKGKQIPYEGIASDAKFAPFMQAVRRHAEAHPGDFDMDDGLDGVLEQLLTQAYISDKPIMVGPYEIRPTDLILPRAAAEGKTVDEVQDSLDETDLASARDTRWRQPYDKYDFNDTDDVIDGLDYTDDDED